MDAKDLSIVNGVYTEDELAVLKKFRQFVDNSDSQEKKLFDDDYLLRFLKARKFNLDKTIAMFSEFLQWRAKNDVANIMDFHFNELEEVRLHYPHGYHKTDKIVSMNQNKILEFQSFFNKGRPIYIERIGVLKLNQLFQATTEERLIKYYIQSYELLINTIFPACSLAAGKPVNQTVTILDLKGIPMKMLSKQVYNFIQLASNVAQQNYPEILGKMFIINAPMLFSGVWAVIKPWIDEKTRNKITIIGSGFKEKLLEIIDIDNIPQFLGGNSTQDISANIGPWNPTGATPLFPCEKPVIQSNENENAELEALDEEEEEEQRQALDFMALRNALAGQISGPQSKAPHNPEKYEITTQGAKFQVSDTPLNTQQEVLIVVIFLMSIRCHRKENIHGIDQRDIQVIENKRKLSEATLLFQEKYHFPVTQSACDNYTESQMIDGQTGEFIPDSIFLERYLIFNALRQVIGFDVKISFQCTDEFSFENLSYAGYFGSQNEYKLSKDSNLYNSLQTYQSDIIYVGRQELQRAASQYVFQFLNILFYFGILLIPFVTGLILLLFKTQKSSIYGYQGQVFSVFRYINRQGDQQMLMWVHKILAFFVALFFFFHYALLLSQMTTQRISVHLVQDFKKNSYRDGVQSQVDLLNQGNSYYLLMVDVFQYSKLTSKFIVNKQLLSSDRQSYFLHLSKSFFSLDEREQIEHQLLEETQNSSSIFNKVRRKSLDNITFLESPLEVNDSSFYLNGFIIAVAFISGLFFKLIQSKVAIFNKFTEIKVHREHCNSDIIKSFRVMFAEKINQLLSKILLANHLNNFNQLSISKNNKFLGKQIYKIIQKRRKRHVKHKKKKINTLVSESKPSEGAQKNVYQSIKQYLLFERKNGVQAARSFRDSPRRQGIVSLLNRPTMTSKQNELNIDLAVSNAIPFNSIQKNKTFSKDNQAEENFSADRKSFQRSVSNVSKRNNFLHFSLTHNSLKNPSTMLESKLHASIFQPKQPLSAHNDTIQSISSENNMPQAIKRSNEFTSRRDENNLKSSQNQQNNLKINLEDCLEDSQKEELDQYNNEFFEAIKSYNSRQQSSRAEIDLNRQEEEKQGHLSFQFHDNNQQAAHSSHIINSPTQIDTEGELVNKSKKMNSNNAEEQSSIDPTLLKKKSYHDNQGKKMRHSSSSHHSKKQKASSNKQTIPKYQSNSISIFQQQYQVNSIQLVNFSNLNELHSHAISVHSNQSKEDKKKQQKQNSQQSISSTEEQQSVGRETLVKISIPPIQYHLNDKQQKSKSGQKTPPEHQTTGSSEKSSNFIKHQNSSSQEINKKISLNSESKSPCNFLSLNATPEIKNEMNLFTEDDMLPDSHLIKDESSSKERRNDNTLRQIF